MADQTTIERLDAILLDIVGPHTEITAETYFAEGLGLDELDMLELVMVVEEEFGIVVDDEDVDKMDTVGKMVEYIDKAVVTQRG